MAQGLITDGPTISSRILALNVSTGAIQSYVWWTRVAHAEDNNPRFQRHQDNDGLEIGKQPSANYLW